MYANFDHDPRRGGRRSDLGEWILALIALMFLWGTLIVMGQHMHP
jgi:hypothetical protein